ncbi:PRC-barrel domain-containing protein [Roseicella aerolata]|uniref:PRC-barrel domain-containing protein n=1 Tax=Roseicella aerolata TaxID=2883479 RepID=A0A9X1LBY4_9PROT|nr:PRC-barrel domain-containing protein [Roseicella aerolata]MCB4823568.1 PRC-barrel domain-containing protein [Roseicella aerolata]
MKHLLLGTAAVLLLAPQFVAAQQAQPQGQPQAQQRSQQPQAQQQGGQAQQQQGGQAAQQQGGGQQQAQAGQQPQAQQCLNDLQAFRQQMRNEGLWLSGYRSGYGWPATTATTRSDQTAVHTAPGTGNTDARAGSEARARAADVQAQGGGAIGTAPAARAGVGQPVGGPWGNVNWRVPPMQEIRTLHAAAMVMAQRGEERGCQTVLSELREAYGQYGQQLRQAGADAGRMGTYRQQQLASAQPVSQMSRAFRADNVTGTDVRNPKDEYLGSVEDVIVDPNNGQISYVILARGGFLGIGQDYIAVPWQRLQATPNMDMFVLNTSEDALEKAPKVDLDAFSNPQTYSQRRQEIDRFWQQQEQNRAG